VSPSNIDKDPRYPMGQFKIPAVITSADLAKAVATIGGLPLRLRETTQGFTKEQFDTPYRQGGWTVRQLIHHVADSHMNALIRVHLALTEDWPTIKPYREGAWAELHDYAAPVEWSLAILDNLHARWAMLLSFLTEEQWECGFVHPERGRSDLKEATLLYQWHSLHHLTHITELKRREGWS
jgi:hypothetical protein